jgi:hypothetical protein
MCSETAISTADAVDIGYFRCLCACVSHAMLGYPQ